jgi:hypothetical protein
MSVCKERSTLQAGCIGHLRQQHQVEKRMAESRDAWAKTEIVAKILAPIVVFAVGTYYTYHQQEKDATEKRFDRYITLGKGLSSENPLEQKIAIVMLKVEKDKHPGEVPDELLTITVPKLMELAANDPSAEVAGQAKALALELTANTTYAESIKNTVRAMPAQVWFHIRSESQRAQAQQDIDLLRSRLATGEFLFPGIRRVHNGPEKAELRYFHKSEKEEVMRLRDILAGIGVQVATHFLGEGKDTLSVRPRLYEVWLGP